jgi:hypothetical protein
VKRLVLLAGLLAVPALPLLTAAPASAVVNVICVSPAGGAGCNQTVATIPQAITAANANALDDTIQLGATTYSDGPYQLIGGAHAITLKGAGQASTFLTLPVSASSQTYVSASQADVRDLTITMASGSSTQDIGLILSSGSLADHVTVAGSGITSGTTITTGLSTLTHVVAQANFTAASGTRGIYSSGGNTISDTSISGEQAFDLSDPGTTDNLSRVTIRSDGSAVLTDGGNIVIDDAVIDLGTAPGALGLGAVNFNASLSSKSITADHVTIVGGGSGSRGAWAYAAADIGRQPATVNLTNSIVRGPETSLVTDAANNGAQGGPSSATVNVSYTDYETKSSTIAPTTGAGGVVEGAGNMVAVDPLFVSGSDRHLTVGSPVIDKGNPAAAGPATDLDGLARVRDGDGNGSAVGDMGAYERPDTIAPDTTITSGPTGSTNDPTPTFDFTSEPGATFECKVDAAAYAACTSPFTTAALTVGAHTFSVRATDLASNVDPTPATRSFTVIADTTAPDTTISSGPTGPTNDPTATFAFTSEAGATFQCKVDAGAYAACTSPFTTATLADGAHTFSVRATDAANNTDASPATRSFTVDTAAPDTTVTKKPAKHSTKSRAKFAFSSSEPAATFQCQLDGRVWVACGATYKVKVKVGKHTLLVRATDAAGNVDATPAKVRFKRVPKP